RIRCHRDVREGSEHRWGPGRVLPVVDEAGAPDGSRKGHAAVRGKPPKGGAFFSVRVRRVVVERAVADVDITVGLDGEIASLHVVEVRLRTREVRGSPRLSVIVGGGAGQRVVGPRQASPAKIDVAVEGGGR